MKNVISSAIARDVFPITPHASNPLTTKAYGIKVTGSAGNIVGTTEAGIQRTIPVAAGEVVPVVFTHINSATTATGLWGYTLFL